MSKPHPQKKTKNPAPSTLHHLVEFSPVETRILSFDDKLEPWSFMIERYHQKSAIGNVYRGVVSALHKQARFGLLDIGEKEPAFVQFKKNQPPVHIGEKLVVQCKRDAFGEKAPLMSEVQTHKKRYLTLKIIPERLSPKKINPPHVHEKYEKNDALAEILLAFVEDHLSAYTLNHYHLQWIFTPFVKKLWQENPDKEVLFSALMQDALQFDDAILKPIALLDKQKGLITASAEKQEDRLLRLMQPQDTLTFRAYGVDTTAYTEKLSLHRKIEPQKSAPPPSLQTAIDTSETIENILQQRHFLNESVSIRIDETPTLTAIDIDSGTRDDIAITQINMLALQTIVRIICVRNLSGIILIDPISTPKKGQSRILVDRLRQAMKLQHPLLSEQHVDVLGASPSGLLELTRERQSPAISEHYQQKVPPHTSIKHHPEAQAAEILHSLSKKAHDHPAAMLHHQPVSLSPHLYKTLTQSYAPIVKELEKKWQDISLWKIKDS